MSILKLLAGCGVNAEVVFGSPVVFRANGISFISTTFDTANSKVVIAYQDSNNGEKGTVVVGTVSGKSITFGTPVVFLNSSTRDIATTYDSTNNKVIIAYRGPSNYGYAVVGTVSGTSISFGSPTTFESGLTTNISTTYDSNSNKVVVAFKDETNSNYGTVKVGSVSGTSIVFNWGPAAGIVFEAADVTYIKTTYDSTNNKVVIIYRDHGNNYNGTIIVGDISSTQGVGIVFGSPVVYYVGFQSQRHSLTHDSTNNKVVVVWGRGASNYGYAVVGTISSTGITLGTAVAFTSSFVTEPTVIYDPDNSKVVIDYNNGSNEAVIIGTVSGTSISFGDPVDYLSVEGYGVDLTYDSTNDKVVIAYRDSANSQHGTAIVGEVN